MPATKFHACLGVPPSVADRWRAVRRDGDGPGWARGIARLIVGLVVDDAGVGTGGERVGDCTAVRDFTVRRQEDARAQAATPNLISISGPTQKLPNGEITSS